MSTHEAMTAGRGPGGRAWQAAGQRDTAAGGAHHERQEELLAAHLVGSAGRGLPTPPVLLTHASVSLRFRKQRKAVVSAGDKKMPNGILEEQGMGVQGVRGAQRGPAPPHPGQSPSQLPPGKTRHLQPWSFAISKLFSFSLWCETDFETCRFVAFFGDCLHPVARSGL